MSDRDAEPGSPGTPGDGIGTSPSRLTNPELLSEMRRAFVWVAVIGLTILAVWVSQSLLVIFGAMVFACMIDGGARLIARAVPLPRTVRVALVLIGVLAFLTWLAYFAGYQISSEAGMLQATVENQLAEALLYLRSQGLSVQLADLREYSGQIMNSLGTVTNLIGGLFGGLTTFAVIIIIGIYVAFEPALYERGMAWMVPRERRAGLHETFGRMAYTMRRLMAGRLVGMFVEGVFTWALLAWYGVPMAALLGILTGLLAFIPNLGALIGGVIMILVGFSGGVEMGLFTIGVYVAIQLFDGYVVIPMIARATVDLAPALVLGAQLIMGVLFGILGLFLADPLMAMIKVALERRAEANEEQQRAEPAALGA